MAEGDNRSSNLLNLLELAGWSSPQEAENGFCGKDSGGSWHLSGNWRGTHGTGCNFKNDLARI
uniref:ADP-ribosylation factor-like 6 interacting protein 1 n=1 Tax=Mus musculus TaxID=10090 RepID=A0A0N4SW86_MOUSE